MRMFTKFRQWSGGFENEWEIVKLIKIDLADVKKRMNVLKSIFSQGENAHW